MKKLLVLILLLATAAGAQVEPRATVRFAWTQPAVTQGGQAVQDGWLKEYRMFVATLTDTVFVGLAPAPAATADSAFAYVSLVIGEPSTMRVQAVDKWDQAGLFSQWSEVTVVIPEPPVEPGQPHATK